MPSGLHRLSDDHVGLDGLQHTELDGLLTQSCRHQGIARQIRYTLSLSKISKVHLRSGA